MARAHEPNGSDHLPQNGNRGKQVAIALFIATTFGIMVILSFPLSRVTRLPLKRPLQAALAPFERLIRPVVPWLGSPFGKRPPPVSSANPRGPSTVSALPSGPSGPGAGTGPPPPPPSEESPTLPGTTTRPGTTLPPTLVRQLTTILSHPAKRLSSEEVRLIRTGIARLRSMGTVCLSDRTCAKLLKRMEKVLRKFEAHQRGPHKAKRRPHGKHGSAEATAGSSHRTSDGRGRGRGAHGKHKKLSKHHKSHGKPHKGHGLNQG